MDLLRAAVPVLEIAYKTRPDNIKAMLSSIYYQLKMNDKHDAIEAGALNVDVLRCLTSLVSFRGLTSPSQRLLPLQSKSLLHSLLRRPRRRRLLLSVASNPPRIP